MLTAVYTSVAVFFWFKISIFIKKNALLIISSVVGVLHALLWGSSEFPRVSHVLSQPAFPTELSQSVCAERRDGVMSWADGTG